MTSTVKLNIGLEVAGTLTHTRANVLAQLPTNWENVICIIRRSNAGELTACIKARTELDLRGFKLVLEYLCSQLKQEAIAAVHIDKLTGWSYLLEGPKAEAWGGAFNPDHWLEPVIENNPLTACDHIIATLAGGTFKLPHWEIGFNAAEGKNLTGWFENSINGNGGGLWLEHNPASNTLELVDYDGVAGLPLTVLIFLRTQGVDADRNFE